MVYVFNVLIGFVFFAGMQELKHVGLCLVPQLRWALVQSLFLYANLGSYQVYIVFVMLSVN
jgi:hypothetical protein